jgi:predicted methyltransferase
VLMKLCFGLSPILCAGACLVAASTGCSATENRAAQGPDSSAVAAPEPNAAPPVATSRPESGAPSGFHLVEFVGLGRGDRIADLGPGRGYSIEPFATAVGPFGAVYVRHDPRTLHALPSEQRSKEPRPPLPANVIRMDTPLEAPFSAEAKNLNCATLLFSYHDLVAEGPARQRFNAAVFRALEPGGCYIIAEHAPSPSAESEAGTAADRIDAGVVRAEVEAAGFRFVEAADFLAPAAATGAPRSAQPSQYVLKFQKPRPR